MLMASPDSSWGIASPALGSSCREASFLDLLSAFREVSLPPGVVPYVLNLLIPPLLSPAPSVVSSCFVELF
ncbi:hypothetical protein NPIL_435351 [Nephila pilipes]|uniref:Uncharacterized protein n=1 Tax=Nephila pilipes TaxID=299642 RepID=A0A8X6I9P6_NEPPI|nr:hypothetical protein NPIL_435351 [Nephila pilipes]